MRAGIEHRATVNRPAKALEQSLLANFDEDDAGGQKEHHELEKHQPQQRLLDEQAVKPGFGDLEAKLIIERFGGGGDKSLRLAQQTHQTAFIQRPFNLAAEARPVHFENKIDERLDGDQRQQTAKNVSDVKVGLSKIGFDTHDANGDNRAQISTEEQVTGTGPEQAMILEPRHGGGEFSEKEKDQREEREHRQGDAGLLEVGRGGAQREPTPDKISTPRLDEAQDDGENGDKKALEL